MATETQRHRERKTRGQGDKGTRRKIEKHLVSLSPLLLVSPSLLVSVSLCLRGGFDYANLVIKRERRAAARATDRADQAGYPQPGFEAGAETSQHARTRPPVQDSFKHGQRRLPRAFGIRVGGHARGKRNLCSKVQVRKHD